MANALDSAVAVESSGRTAGRSRPWFARTQDILV